MGRESERLRPRQRPPRSRPPLRDRRQQAARRARLAPALPRLRARACEATIDWYRDNPDWWQPQQKAVQTESRSTRCFGRWSRGHAAAAARGWSRGARRWPGSSARLRRSGVLGPPDPRVRRSQAARRRARARPGRPRRQPHRADLHRRPLRRLAVRGALAGRTRQPADVGLARRRPGAERLLGDGRGRCAPPANKPTPASATNCAAWLRARARAAGATCA